MDNSKIAHDLAILKLNSDLNCKELVNQYRKYYKEILNELNSTSDKPKTVVGKSPF